MSGSSDETGLSGLKFFGTMTAAVSHDIKNVMAIINENAGLIKDLIHMSQKGPPLDVERINTLADRCARQVVRADIIIKDLNQFSHSVDEPVKQVDLAEVMKLTLSLSGRFSRLRGVTVDFDAAPPSVFLTTNPFFLSHLLWLCVDYAMDAVGEEKKITIGIQRRDTDIRIHFRGLCAHSDECRKPLFTAQGKHILDLLEAELETDETHRLICVTIPISPKNRHS
jgi:C4-dicarboxylate-specific signal transduction histidine kinase